MQERNARVKVPEKAKRGEVIQIRCMVMHPMENGYRFDTQGTRIPVHLIHTFICRYNGEEVFRARLGTGMAANPQLSFHTVATETGTLEFQWHDDDGNVTTAHARIEVE
ncbi:thiosulfate oxidation carrier complex protein SoxZ [Azohydromonas australica]|uniref:thiosulfate oxidation carrier complex protein SoxZ n=1 Tax=Azohydromonas australica TaxID=364039 RepID=UPI000422BFC6|nr:thiosulfate oxidation carrier complex protein SoxZ [Azohydromonas australica]